MSSTPPSGSVGTDATRANATHADGHYTALICRALSDNLSGLALEQVARRPLAPDEIRVRMRATALGYIAASKGSLKTSPVFL